MNFFALSMLPSDVKIEPGSAEKTQALTMPAEIKQEDDDDLEEIIFVGEFTKNDDTHVQKAPLPPPIPVSNSQNVLQAPTTQFPPRRYLRVSNGIAQFTDVISSSEDTSSESSDEEEASASSESSESSESSDEKESTSSSYSKRVSKVERDRTATKKKIASAFEKIKEKRRSNNQMKKRRVIYSNSESDEIKDDLHRKLNIQKAKNSPPHDTWNMPSTSKAFYTNDYAEAQQSEPSMAFTSSDASSNKAEASDSDDKNEIYSKLYSHDKNLHAKNLPLSKSLFNDSSFAWPTQDSSSRAATAVSAKRPHSDRFESNEQIRKKTVYRPRKVHPVCAAPGGDWKEKIEKLNYNAPRIIKPQSSYNPAFEQPKLQIQQHRIKFIKEMKRILDKRIAQTEPEEDWTGYKGNPLDDLCVEIENETYKAKASSNSMKRYTEQYRALKSNLDDDANPDFWRDLLLRHKSPQEIAQMSALDMASLRKKKERDEQSKKSTKGHILNALANRDREKKLRQEIVMKKMSHKGEAIAVAPSDYDKECRLTEEFKSSLPAQNVSELRIRTDHKGLKRTLDLQRRPSLPQPSSKNQVKLSKTVKTPVSGVILSKFTSSSPIPQMRAHLSPPSISYIVSSMSAVQVTGQLSPQSPFKSQVNLSKTGKPSVSGVKAPSFAPLVQPPPPQPPVIPQPPVPQAPTFEQLMSNLIAIRNRILT